MKNLQEIINEMNNLSKEIAVELNDEEIVEIEQPVESVSDLTSDSASSCVNTINRFVNFCCTINFPGKFTAANSNATVIFDLSCLKCIVEECTTSANVAGITCPVTVFNVRIVGCIPFIVNLPVLNTNLSPDKICARPLQGSTIPTVYACCNDSVCVDNVICRRCSKQLADAACRSIESNLTCAGVAVSNLDVDNISGDGCTTRRISGNFILPNCPSI